MVRQQEQDDRGETSPRNALLKFDSTVYELTDTVICTCAENDQFIISA